MKMTNRPDRCLLCEARLSNPICQLPAGAFDRIFGESRVAKCEPGAVLFRQGDMTPDIVIIRAGQVKIVFEHPDGAEQILRLAGPGETLGLSRKPGQGMPVTAIARKGVSVCRTHLSDVDRLIHSDPEFALAWAHVLADEMERTRESLLLHGPQPAAVRLARLLSTMSADDPDLLKGRFPAKVSMTHGELASTLSLAQETVTRLLSVLEEQHVVRLGRLIDAS
ncbi:MAG: Crp/FNR family transcriptional regulator [bacterium]|nr:MAG: Crp/FNR family transcriptional regulator [bacterium]